MGREVGVRQGAARAREIGGDPPRQLAAVEIVEAGHGEPGQAFRECRVLEAAALRRRRTAGKVDLGEARHLGELAALRSSVLRLGGGDGITLAGVERGVVEEACQAHAAAEPGACRERCLPAGDRARDRDGGERAARRDGREAVAAVERQIGGSGGAAAGLDRRHCAAAGRDQHEAVAAEPGHVRIDHHGDGRGRDHGLDRVAALAQHGQPALRRQVMGCYDHPPRRPQGIQHGNCPRPRRCECTHP